MTGINFLRQRLRDGAPGRGPGQHAAVRRRSHAGVPGRIGDRRPGACSREAASRMLTGDADLDVLAGRRPTMPTLDAGPLQLDGGRDPPGRLRAAVLVPPDASCRPACTPPPRRCWSCWPGRCRTARGGRSPWPRPGSPAAAGCGRGASWWAASSTTPPPPPALASGFGAARRSRSRAAAPLYDRAELAVQTDGRTAGLSRGSTPIP